MADLLKKLRASATLDNHYDEIPLREALLSDLGPGADVVQVWAPYKPAIYEQTKEAASSSAGHARMCSKRTRRLR